MPTGAVSRAHKLGAPIYCSRVCAGLARRKNKTVAEKKEEKRLYDIAYRAEHAERRAQQYAEWFRQHYDPVAAAVARKANMPRHVEYCRQPAYKAKKRVYDRKRRALVYGEFAEAHSLLVDIKHALREEGDWYERHAGTDQIGKTQRRKRQAALADGGKS